MDIYALYNDKYANDLIDIGIKKSELTNMKIRIKKKFNKKTNPDKISTSMKESL